MKYASTYSENAAFSEELNTSVIINSIPNTEYVDGRTPWPYVKINFSESIDSLKNHHDLISLVGVTAPSDKPPLDNGDFVFFKNHFIYDPSLPAPILSKKSKSNLKSGIKTWSPEENKNPETKLAFISLYQDLVARRNLSGTSFNFQVTHFNKLFELPEITLFGVSNLGAWGSIACAARYSDEIHLLHIVNSHEGLRSNASYVLMDYLIDYCFNKGITLFLGGIPEGDDGGVLRFKERWSNTNRPSWLMRLILKPDLYRQLEIPGNSFFPSYRKSW